MDSVRKYNNDKVAPLLAKQSGEELLLESIPSYSVREVFETLTTVYKEQYRDYSYKDAMINPTNSKDKATEDEIKIINKLSQQDRLELAGDNIDQGFLLIDGKNRFYNARPIKISQSSCLSCHNSLEKAPKSLQRLYKKGQYGATQGFGWELNKVIGAKIVYVPTDEVYKAANEKFIPILAIFIVIFALAILLANLWLKQYVVRPLNRITQAVEAVSLGNMAADFESQSNDNEEFRRLTEAFMRMKTSLEIAMRRLVKKSNRSPDESS
jgi:methyl-accepting chemotaxis protein